MQSIGAINVNSNIYSNAIKNNPIINNKNTDEESSKLNFDQVIKDAINKVNQTQVNANNNIEALIKGDNVTMHDVMLSMQESQLSMQLMVEVRNNIVDAYKELNSVQL